MDLRSIRGVGPAFAQRLREAGVHDVADLAWVSDLSSLSEKTGIPAARLADFQAQAVRLVASRHRPPAVALQSVAYAVFDLVDEVKDLVTESVATARGWVLRATTPKGKQTS